MHPHKKTSVLLLFICVGLSVPLTFWTIYQPAELIEALGILDTISLDASVWIFSVVLVATYCAYTVHAVPLVRQHLFSFSPLKLLALLAALLTGVVEEVFFRRILMDTLNTADYSSFIQITVSAVSFGLIHLIWIFNSRELRAMLPVVLATTVLGAALASLYILADRNLFPCIVAHAAINMIIEPWLLLASIIGFDKKGPT